MSTWCLRLFTSLHSSQSSPVHSSGCDIPSTLTQPFSGICLLQLCPTAACSPAPLSPLPNNNPQPITHFVSLHFTSTITRFTPINTRSSNTKLIIDLQQLVRGKILSNWVDLQKRRGESRERDREKGVGWRRIVCVGDWVHYRKGLRGEDDTYRKR